MSSQSSTHFISNLSRLQHNLSRLCLLLLQVKDALEILINVDEVEKHEKVICCVLNHLIEDACKVELQVSILL